MYIVKSAVKKKVKSIGKRVGKGFMHALDRMVEEKIVSASMNTGKFKCIKGEDVSPWRKQTIWRTQR